MNDRMALAQHLSRRLSERSALTELNQLRLGHRHVVAVGETGEEGKCLEHLLLVPSGGTVDRDVDVAVVANAETCDCA